MPPRRAARGASSPADGEQLPWAVIYYQAPDVTAPALAFLDSCPARSTLSSPRCQTRLPRRRRPGSPEAAS